MLVHPLEEGRRGELDSAHALLAARALQGTDVELLPTRHLLESATRLALDLDHAAYDCVHLALALENDWPFVTADMRLRRKLERAGNAGATYQVLSMHEAASR